MPDSIHVLLIAKKPLNLSLIETKIKCKFEINNKFSLYYMLDIPIITVILTRNFFLQHLHMNILTNIFQLKTFVCYLYIINIVII